MKLFQLRRDRKERELASYERSIVLLCETVKDLSDKVIAKNVTEYKAISDEHQEERQQPSQLKEDTNIDIFDADPKELLDSLHGQDPDRP